MVSFPSTIADLCERHERSSMKIEVSKTRRARLKLSNQATLIVSVSGGLGAPTGRA
jgi:hypothetical protein